MESGLADDETGATVWDAGICLGEALMKKQVRCGERVLEIGAGTGYVGLIAAALGASVTFTDQPQLLELLRKNVERNALAGAGVAELTWGDEAALRALAGPAGSRLLHSPPRLSPPTAVPQLLLLQDARHMNHRITL